MTWVEGGVMLKSTFIHNCFSEALYLHCVCIIYNIQHDLWSWSTDLFFTLPLCAYWNNMPHKTWRWLCVRFQSIQPWGPNYQLWDLSLKDCMRVPEMEGSCELKDGARLSWCLSAPSCSGTMLELSRLFCLLLVNVKDKCVNSTLESS